MRKLFILLSFLSMVSTPCYVYGAAPSRTTTYTSGTTIRAADVTSNEDALFNYLRNGIDTISDGTIVNADVSGSAAIDSTKLNLATINQAITFSGNNTFAGTTIANLGTVTTGVISGIDLNGGAIDGTEIGTTVQNKGKFSSLETTGFLKVGTTNQGDILYDNGVSLTRLTPGTSGQFLQTKGASANPVWAIDNNYSNVLFQYSAAVSTIDNSGEMSAQASLTPTEGGTYRFLAADKGSLVTVWATKWTKISGISTITIYAQIWNSATTTGQTTLKVDVGGQNGTVTSTAGQKTPEWKSFTIDVSSLTNSTVYDVTVQIYPNEGSGTAYLGNLISFGS